MANRARAEPRAPTPAPRTAPHRPAHPASPRRGGHAHTPPKLPHPSPLPGSSVGSPLAPQMASPISSSLGVDVSPVRVHSDATSVAASGALGARAFTVGGHVFLGVGERPTDLPLIAHEVAHAVQQQGAPRVQLWSTAGNDPHEHEAHRASSAVVRQEPFTVRQRTAPQVQRLGISDVLDYFADKANLIPGYRMFTLMIGFNPINMSTVERTAANFLRALIELIPGGGIITQVLDKYGVIDHAGAWIDEQIKSIGISGASIRKAIGDFIGSLGWRDIFHLGDVWDRAKRIFTDPIGRLIDFGRTVIKGVLRFVREAVLAPLAKLAEGTRGWPLLKAVLGEDPITGEPVPRNADTLIGGFMTLIGQQEIWENIKRANAIPRAWAWFQGALSGLMGLIRSIPDRFIAALKDLDFSDFIILPSAFAKLARVFGAFVMDFLSWAGNQVLSLLQIIFEVVAPGAMQYVRKAAGAFKEIIRAPIRFVGNLVSAAKLGFQNFASNFLEHLKAGLIDWLTGSLPGIYIPKGFTVVEILKFVLSVLGLTWENIRGKLVKTIGETAVKVLETGFDIVVKLVREGPAAAWEAIKEQLSNLKDMVIGGITDFVVDTVVKKAIPQLVALFIPGAGFITAIVKIYDTIMVFVEKISKIIQVVTGFIDSIAAIAAGAIGGAAKKVESTLANLLSLAISFLAGFAGLGKVSDKIMGVIQKIRAPIDKALDWLIGWIVNAAKRLGKLVAQAGVPEDPKQRLDLGLTAAVKAVNALQGASVSAALINPALGAIKVRYGFSSLTARERGGKWWVTGTVNPPDEKETAKQVGPAGQTAPAGSSSANPIEIRWFKPAVSAYPPIVLAPPADVAAKRAGGSRISLTTLNTIPTKFTAHPTQEPLRSLGARTIGVTNAMSQTKPDFVFQADAKESGTSQVRSFNDLIEAWGYNRDDNAAPPTDGDHVMEKQLGGPDAYSNLWPLNSGINRSSGGKVSGEIARIKQANNLKDLKGVWLKLKF
jgi:hypothetical protein